MFSHIRAVFFDLDETLAGTLDLILAAHKHTFGRHLRGPWPSRAEIIGNLGRSLTESLRNYAARDGQEVAEEAARQMLATYRAFQREHHAALTRPIPGIRETVEALSSAGVALAVVTSKVEWMARITLADVGLDGMFSVGVFHDDTERHKPAPEPLLLASARAGVDPSAALYVGDSVHDVAAARAAGMMAVAAAWGPFDRAVLEASGPDAIADRPGQIADWLRK